MPTPRSSPRPARPPRRGRRLTAAIAGLVALAALTLWPGAAARLLRLAGGDPAALLRLDPTPAAVADLDNGAIAVYFTTPELVYPDEPRHRVPPAVERAMLADIDGARRSVDLASFEYNLPSVAEALVRAHRRGVAVRVVLDREVLVSPPKARWAGSVEEAGIPVSWEQSSAFLHSKFVIVDRRVVWMGSWNATVNDTYRNNNNLLRITSAPLVANYAAEFEQMAAGGFSTGKGGATPNPVVRRDDVTVESYFSPRDPVAARLVTLIGQARQSVDVLAFAFTADDVGAALMERQRAGVPVRAVFEARNAQGIGSEFDRLRNAGVIALEDGNCYTMHHKVMIIDRRIVVTGSYNFTGRAEELNDENLLILHHPGLAAAYLHEFERVYAQAQVPTRCV